MADSKFLEDVKRAHKYLTEPEKRRLFPDDAMYDALVAAAGMWSDTLSTCSVNRAISEAPRD